MPSSVTVSTPLPSFASLMWNMLLSVSKLAIYVPLASFWPALDAADAEAPLALEAAWLLEAAVEEEAALAAEALADDALDEVPDEQAKRIVLNASAQAQAIILIDLFKFVHSSRSRAPLPRVLNIRAGGASKFGLFYRTRKPRSPGFTGTEAFEDRLGILT